LKECEDEIHIPEIGTWESSGTPETSEFNYKGQNTLYWNVLYIIRKLSKCRCRKFPCMGHLDICGTSYGKKKGRESNWQFDSRPLKVRNWPDLGACGWNVIHCWKSLKESYKFASNLISIEGLSKELWPHKVSGVQTETISRLLLRSSIWMWVPRRGTKYTIWGKVLASLESGPLRVLWVQSCQWLVLALKVFQKMN
jgi:hypothetical protein